MIAKEILTTDILIIGGGAAGCQAAIHARECAPELEVVIIEKGNIERSGCLAAGVNAINAYLTEGETPESYVNYVKRDSAGLIREDLTLSIGKRLNEMSYKLEKYGLPFQKDDNGNYVARGKRSVKINGERIKPILADAALKSGAKILNRVAAVEFIKSKDRIAGIYGFSVREDKFYVIYAKTVIIATGGAAGIYKSNNSGAAKRKTWYSPFNTGAGLAMGIKAGAEMTTFEMRFIALRTKDTISPTGTIAQGVNAEQINGLGERYMDKYSDKSTPMRLWATIEENKIGKGPCYLDITKVKDEDNVKLKEAYLNMSPGIVLKWSDEEIEPNMKPVEICGTEPYVNGGHGQAGYWINDDRRTSLKGLYAAGDIAGGSPKKYVTGSMAEGEIAVEAAIEEIREGVEIELLNEDQTEEKKKEIFEPLTKCDGKYRAAEIEERLQKIMDEYAGGISQNYEMSETKLLIAREKLKILEKDGQYGYAENIHELMNYYEAVERIIVAKILVEHLLYRKETRWKCYQERVDYPKLDDTNWFKFVNSVYDSERNEIKIIEREWKGLGDKYEHKD